MKLLIHVFGALLLISICTEIGSFMIDHAESVDTGLRELPASPNHPYYLTRR